MMAQRGRGPKAPPHSPRRGAFALLSERHAQVAASDGRLRTEADGVLEVLDRLGWLALLKERRAQVGAGVGIVRSEADGLREGLERLGQVAPAALPGATEESGFAETA